jgi:hypothetical protein
MDRVLVDTAAVASVAFQEDGATVDPGVVTVTITREDGTVLETDDATDGTGAAVRSYELSAATHTGELDELTLVWESPTKGTLTTYLEVVGGFHFTIAEARALAPLSNTTTYAVASIVAARTVAESALEDECGVAFVPRYFRTKVDGSGGFDVLLEPRPLTITEVIVGASSASAGTTLSGDELDDLELYEDGRVYSPTRWTWGRRNVQVKGTRGYPSLPPYVKQASLALAKQILVDTPVDPRTVSMANDSGAVQLFKEDGAFSLPAVDRVVSLYGASQGIG